jgi:GxxExxY protein
MFRLMSIRLPRVNEVTGRIVTAAMKVHSQLGPGLLESASEACLLKSQEKKGYKSLDRLAFRVVYDEETIELGYRIAPPRSRPNACLN